MTKIIFFLFALLFISISSCENYSDENSYEKVKLTGKSIILEDDNIQLFLPNYYKQFGLNEYENTINLINDSLSRVREYSRFNKLKYSKGNVYFFKDLSNSTDITVKMIDYHPFTKSDSSKMLGIISQLCNAEANLDNKKCTKLKAGFSANRSTRVFMAKYEIDSNFLISYHTFYAISSNNKSFIITFRSNNDVNYNEYIEKIIVR